MALLCKESLPLYFGKLIAVLMVNIRPSHSAFNNGTINVNASPFVRSLPPIAANFPLSYNLHCQIPILLTANISLHNHFHIHLSYAQPFISKIKSHIELVCPYTNLHTWPTCHIYSNSIKVLYQMVKSQFPNILTIYLRSRDKMLEGNHDFIACNYSAANVNLRPMM